VEERRFQRRLIDQNSTRAFSPGAPGLKAIAHSGPETRPWKGRSSTTSANASQVTGEDDQALRIAARFGRSDEALFGTLRDHATRPNREKLGNFSFYNDSK